MAASAKLKSKKEYVVLALESVDQLEARLKDQQDHGWEFVQALSHGSRLVAIFSKETPSA
jgi:hypothetical protein